MNRNPTFPGFSPRPSDVYERIRLAAAQLRVPQVPCLVIDGGRVMQRQNGEWMFLRLATTDDYRRISELNF